MIVTAADKMALRRFHTCPDLRMLVRIRLSPTESRDLDMRTTRQLSITLPDDMADALREGVRSGGYASESEVIREGLQALFARDQAIKT